MCSYTFIYAYYVCLMFSSNINSCISKHAHFIRSILNFLIMNDHIIITICKVSYDYVIDCCSTAMICLCFLKNAIRKILVLVLIFRILRHFANTSIYPQPCTNVHQFLRSECNGNVYSISIRVFVPSTTYTI